MNFNDAVKSFQNEISKVTISILDYIEKYPGVSSSSIINKMTEEYPLFSKRDYFNDDVRFILDVLSDKKFVYFDFTEDMWYLVNNQQESFEIH
tara:strand:- start:193 stop:471 length:279 start_codon:yes stop_codon:yes gene_type:complete